MFGDRKELILPLVLDIANLVRMAAESNDAAPQRNTRQTPSAEFLHAEPEAQPSAPDLAIHDDRLSIDVDDEPEIMETSEGSQGENRGFIVTRSAPFYDHLLKMVPNFKGPGKRQPILQRRVDSGAPPKPPPTLPLNQKPFLVPSTPAVKSSFQPAATTPTLPLEAYNEVEDLALNSLNGTGDSEALASETGPDSEDNDDAGDEEALPTAEKLIGGRYRTKPHSRYSHRKPQHSSTSLCEKFTGSVCLRVEDYPM